MSRKSRLLIVDDELDHPVAEGLTRRELYEKLSSDFDLIFLERPADLHRIVEQNAFDAVLADFLLGEWRMDARDIVREVPEGTPVALISQSWSASLEGLSAAIDAFPIARLFIWEDMKTPRTREIMVFWINAAIRNRHGFSAARIDDNETIRIVQFSDTQFNAKDGKGHETDTQIALQTIQSFWAEPPHLLCLPGDIAEAGRPVEYRMAEAWVETMRKRLGQGRRHVEVVTVPGNHDVCRPLALATRVDGANKTLDVSGVPYPELAEFAFTPYREFSRKVEPADRWDGRRNHWVSAAYRHSGFVLFGVNSSEELTEWGVPTRVIPDKTLAALFRDIETVKRQAPEALVVGLMHHPLDGGGQSVSNGAEFRRGITDVIGPVVLLTGHVHEDTTLLSVNARRPSVLQIGSSTFTLSAKSRPEDSLRGFNLIELQRMGGVVTAITVQTFVISSHHLQKLSAEKYLYSRGKLVIS